MKPFALFAIALTIFLVGCGNGKTTDTLSTAFSTVAEKQEFLERYVKFRRRYDDLHFRLSFIDGGSGRTPGPTEWDICVFAIVPAGEIDQWIDGLSAATEPELNWVSDIPEAPNDLSDFDWHEDGRRLVGIDREKRIVLYRNHAS